MSDPKTTIAAYGAASGAVFFGLTANEFAAVVGAICAILTFVVNWYFKYRQLKVIESRVNSPFPELLKDAE